MTYWLILYVTKDFCYKCFGRQAKNLIICPSLHLDLLEVIFTEIGKLYEFSFCKCKAFCSELPPTEIKLPASQSGYLPSIVDFLIGCGREIDSKL